MRSTGGEQRWGAKEKAAGWRRREHTLLQGAQETRDQASRAGPCWTLLDPAGPCWTLLDPAGQ